MDPNGRQRNGSVGSNNSLPNSSTFRRLPQFARSPFRRGDKGVSPPPDIAIPSSASNSALPSTSEGESSFTAQQIQQQQQNTHHRGGSTFPSLSLKRDDLQLSSSLYGLSLPSSESYIDLSEPAGSRLAPPSRTSSLPQSPNSEISPNPQTTISESSSSGGIPLYPPLSPFPPKGSSRSMMFSSPTPPPLPNSATFANLGEVDYVPYPSHMAQTTRPANEVINLNQSPQMTKSPHHTPSSSFNNTPDSPLVNSPLGVHSSPIPGQRTSSRQRDPTMGSGSGGILSGYQTTSNMTPSSSQQEFESRHGHTSGSGSSSSPKPGSGGPPMGVPRRKESMQFTSLMSKSLDPNEAGSSGTVGILQRAGDRPIVEAPAMSGTSNSSASSTGATINQSIKPPIVPPRRGSGSTTAATAGSSSSIVNLLADSSASSSTAVAAAGPMSSVLNLSGGSGSGGGQGVGMSKMPSQGGEDSDDMTVRRRRAGTGATAMKSRSGERVKEQQRDRQGEGSSGRDSERERDPDDRSTELRSSNDRNRGRDRDRDRAKKPTPLTGYQTTPPKTNAFPKLPSNKQTPYAPPSSMYFSPLPTHGNPPPQPLRAHTGTLVGNRIWFIGGVDQKVCWRGVGYLDTETFAWRAVETFGEVLPGLRAHTTTLVGEGLLYVFGGGDGPNYSNDVWVFDTVTHRFSRPNIATPRTSLPLPRRAHTTVLYRNFLVVFGGGNGQAALNDVWALDVSDPGRLTWHEWRTRGDIPGKKGYHSANLVGDRMVVFGGSDGHASFADVHVLNLKTLTWTLINTEVKHNRLSHTSTQVGSYLFIIGGHNGQSYAQNVLLFNLVTLAWESKAPRGVTPPGRGYHVSLLHDARIFISGGYNGVSVFDDLWVLDLSAGAYLPQVTTFTVDETAEHVRQRSSDPVLIAAS